MKKNAEKNKLMSISTESLHAQRGTSLGSFAKLENPKQITCQIMKRKRKNFSG